MPMYVYRCNECSLQRDVQHSMMEDPEITCEDCAGVCQRVPQIAGVSLKGKGWYKNSGRKENGEPL